MGIRILKGSKPKTGPDRRKAIEIPVEVEEKGAAAIAAYMKNPKPKATEKTRSADDDGGEV